MLIHNWSARFSITFSGTKEEAQAAKLAIANQYDEAIATLSQVNDDGLVWELVVETTVCSEVAGMVNLVRGGAV